MLAVVVVRGTWRWGWGTSQALSYVFGAEAWSRFSNVRRLVDEISARPVGQSALALATRFTFKKEFDVGDGEVPVSAEYGSAAAT